MSDFPYQNIPGLQITDMVCRNDGKACAILSGNVLVFELDASLLKNDTLHKLTSYLRVLGINTTFVIVWGYDSQGNYKPGYYAVLPLTYGVGANFEQTGINPPDNVAQGDIWYFAVYPAAFNKHLLKVVLETL